MYRMNKIITLFKRDMANAGRITKEYALPEEYVKAAQIYATEKLDGTNVRLTVRSHTLVRVEKRNNPTKEQKSNGIIEPWYIDAKSTEPSDRWLMEAAQNTDLSTIDDGEWSGEALGPKIQGNPLNLESHRVVLFSCDGVPIFDNVPLSYDALKEWLPKQKSKYGNNCGIEGIVWHDPAQEFSPVFKIKTKDFT